MNRFQIMTRCLMLLPLSILLMAGTAWSQEFYFDNQALEAGVAGTDNVEESRAALADINNDGLLDIYLPQRLRPEQVTGPSVDKMFINETDTNITFTDIYESRIGAEYFTLDAKFFDYDNDGLQDLIVAGYEPTRVYLYKQLPNQDVQFALSTFAAGSDNASQFLVGDFNNDSLLDFMTGDKVYVNEAASPGEAFRIQALSSIGIDATNIASPLLLDYDDDGDMDILVSRSSLQLYRNNGDFSFTNVSAETMAALRELNEPDRWFSMTGRVAPGDYDNDGDIDLYITRTTNKTVSFEPVLLENKLYDNGVKGDPVFSVATEEAGVAISGEWPDPRPYDSAFADFDNDGDLDLFLAAKRAHDNPDRLYLNNGEEEGYTFTLVPEHTVAEREASSWEYSHLSLGDINNDGFMDLYLQRDHLRNQINVPWDNALLINNSFAVDPALAANNYLKVKLVGTQSNRDAIGAKVYAHTSNGKTLYREVSSHRGQSLIAHFGLGQATVSNVEIIWPSGTVDVVTNVNLNELLVVEEGSAPPIKFLRGDANSDGEIDVSDPSFIVNYLYQAGDVPECLDAADANDDGFIDQSDAIFLNTFMYNAGEAPPAPFPDLGIDPTDDNLTCLGGLGGGGGGVPEFLRGDVNGDGSVEESDHYVLYDYVYAGEDNLTCLDAADINDDGVIDETDWVDLIYHLYLAYDTIAEPFPDPGVDPTTDNLDCADY